MSNIRKLVYMVNSIYKKNNNFICPVKLPGHDKDPMLSSSVDVLGQGIEVLE